MGLDAAAGRSSPIHQMSDYLFSGLLGRELREWQHCLQQLSHVGSREGRQHLYLQLARQLRVTLMGLGPVQLDLSYEPQRSGGQGQVMLPRPALLRLEIVPAYVGLGVLKDTFDEIASTTPLNQELPGVSSGAFRSV